MNKQLVTIERDGTEYVNFTDLILKFSKCSIENAKGAIKDWLNSNSGKDALYSWEAKYNKGFTKGGINPPFKSISDFVTKTNAKSIYVVRGKHGGTFVHRDIAELYTIQRMPSVLYALKDKFNELAKGSLVLRYDARNTNKLLNSAILEQRTLENKKPSQYAFISVANMINSILFGFTRTRKGTTVRDVALERGMHREISVLPELEAFVASIYSVCNSRQELHAMTAKKAKQLLNREKKNNQKRLDIVKSL